jgi:hypothetical protein
MLPNPWKKLVKKTLLLCQTCCGAHGRSLFNKLNFSIPDVARPLEKLVK